jgi:hypothetical protein
VARGSAPLVFLMLRSLFQHGLHKSTGGLGGEKGERWGYIDAGLLAPELGYRTGLPYLPPSSPSSSSSPITLQVAKVRSGPGSGLVFGFIFVGVSDLLSAAAWMGLAVDLGPLWLGAYRDSNLSSPTFGWWSWVDGTNATNVNCGPVGCGPYGPGEPE